MEVLEAKTAAASVSLSLALYVTVTVVAAPLVSEANKVAIAVLYSII